MVDPIDLLDALVQREVESMDMKDLIRLAYEVLEERYAVWDDEEIRQHAAQNYPEMLEELDELSEGV